MCVECICNILVSFRILLSTIILLIELLLFSLIVFNRLCNSLHIWFHALCFVVKRFFTVVCLCSSDECSEFIFKDFICLIIFISEIVYVYLIPLMCFYLMLCLSPVVIEGLSLDLFLDNFTKKTTIYCIVL